MAAEEQVIDPLGPRTVGERVRFAGDRYWWTVRATDERYTILTRQGEFRPKGELAYTIIDRERAVRGPCNLVGQGWAVDEPDGCESLLRALQNQDEINARLEAGEEAVEVVEPAVEVSYRNNVPVEIEAVR